MQYTHEHEELRRTLKRFIDEEINPHVEQWEEAEIFPAHEVFKKMGALGLLGLTKPEAYGGSGLDYSYSMVMAETLGHIHCGGVPMAIGVQTDMCTPALARFGSDELRREFLVPAIKGDYVGCVAVSEPGGGSDVAALKTTARKQGGDYVINGSKMWITNGLQADWCCLLANTSEGPAHKNKSLIMVPMNLPGITKQKIHKIGMGWLAPAPPAASARRTRASRPCRSARAARATAAGRARPSPAGTSAACARPPDRPLSSAPVGTAGSAPPVHAPRCSGNSKVSGRPRPTCRGCAWRSTS